MKNYKRLLMYMKPYLGRLGLAVFCIIMASGANLYLPWIIKDMIDKVLSNGNMGTLNFIAISIVVVFAFRGFFYYWQSYLVSYIGQRVVADVREVMFRKFQRMPMAYFDKHQTGETMSYVTNDVAAVQSALVDNLIDLVTESAILIGSICLMLYINWTLTLLTLITIPMVGYAMKILGRKIKRAGTIIQEKMADITSLLQESISSIRIVKSFVREDYEIQRFIVENDLNFEASMRNAKLTSRLTPTVEFLAALGVTLIVWYGGYEVVHGVMTAGELVAFLTYAVNLANPVKRLSRIYGKMQQAMAAIDRIFSVLDLEEPVNDKPDSKILPKVRGHVSVENVTFSYDGQHNALENVTFDVKPGQMIAFVGPSGAGKSTIANLIPRFYDVNEGAIKIDGLDIRDVTLKSLREQIGIVPQETLLFSTTVMENIRYGRLDATDDEVIAAAKAANADAFIKNLPQGYQTPIGERGLNLSGGQRQRMAIARAMLKNPQILILDEATSALDTESEKIVQSALDELMIGRTSFVIAHRLSTIFAADQIFVIDKGKICEHGTHHELLKINGVYSHLYNIQFSNL